MEYYLIETLMIRGGRFWILVIRWHAMWERPFIRTMAEWLDVASRSREMEALTTDEWVAFEGSYYDPIQKPASINVLEYFVVMHMIT